MAVPTLAIGLLPTYASMGILAPFGIFAAGYLARPLGGIIMAHFGDLVGRKKMLPLASC